ncbi:AEC family transporter [Dysosmobacter sp.]|uniref:AEC family transporter n=1 Tax=Dysosmobacter sp. TaxID=2591382 RepID=UPI002A880CCB|nr:AEC family transporter [Dysosmobacter sp.]MDY3282589.1 hypothetical protein [Dysosmobacter sp.]
MRDVYYKTLIMIVIICLGQLCLRVGVFQKSDAKTISKIIMNITLPCVVVKNINGVTLDLDILTAVIIGIAANCFFFAQTFVFSRADDPEDRLVKVFSFSSFNIGNYVIPLLSDFISPHALAGVLAYNYPGTAMFTYGFPPVVASMAVGAKDAGSPWVRLKNTLLHNVTLLTCVFMLTLSLMGLALPAPVVGICTSISNANSTLAMLSIGILLDLHFPKGEFLYYLRIVAVRFSCAVICATAIYFLAPVSDELRRALMLTVFAPIASSNPILALHCGYTGSRVAVVNSMYLLVSIVSMSVLTLLLY